MANCDKLKCPKSVNIDILYFVLKCVSDLIQHQKYFKFTSCQRKDVVRMCKPFECILRKLSDCSKREKYVMAMRSKSQKGSGVFATLLISALMPILTSIIQKITKNISELYLNRSKNTNR